MQNFLSNSKATLYLKGTIEQDLPYNKLRSALITKVGSSSPSLFMLHALQLTKVAPEYNLAVGMWGKESSFLLGLSPARIINIGLSRCEHCFPRMPPPLVTSPFHQLALRILPDQYGEMLSISFKCYCLLQFKCMPLL